MTRDVRRFERYCLAGARALAVVLAAWLVPAELRAEGVGSDTRAVESHWAYEKPQRPELPEVEDTDGVRNPIDRFVLARLKEEGFTLSEPAEPAQVIRRVFLDLIGLPPSVEEVDAFLNDDRPDAYDRLVDRLLRSRAYGERWAQHWLDLARYADSHGYQSDQMRETWPYRDWVIDAINDDMPFDQFTIEQLAGDLLPDAREDQQIATGFQRQAPLNIEGGVNPEEARVEQVADRVNTLGTVWLGTTMECAQCHNHKYDPFSIHEYYQLYAFFNNTPLEVEIVSSTATEFEGPILELPTPQHKAVREKLEAARQKHEAVRERAVEQGLAEHPEVREAQAKVAEAEQELEALGRVPTTLVMVEKDQEDRRTTRILRRGNYRTPGERVEPGTPRVLHPMDAGLPRNRLGLAKWLVDPDNPLTARVTVNRWWAELFGSGLVRSAEDLGSQGEPPTHPELLDYLADEFVASGWSTKHMHRLMVTSATYRQSARASSELRQQDPENELLGRASRRRLPAETIRDNALAISGLLVNKQGGPPVYPPQPEGIWRHIGRNQPNYEVNESDDRFRRGVYVVWRRSAPYASFVTFDAPDRATCTVTRSRTNTPLQALAMMNDRAYVEMAWGLAGRIATADGPDDLEARIRYAFRLAVARHPSEREHRHLLEVYLGERDRLAEDPDRVAALTEKQRVPQGVEPAELAAWFHIAAILLNLDETITRG